MFSFVRLLVRIIVIAFPTAMKQSNTLYQCISCITAHRDDLHFNILFIIPAETKRTNTNIYFIP